MAGYRMELLLGCDAAAACGMTFIGYIIGGCIIGGYWTFAAG